MNNASKNECTSMSLGRKITKQIWQNIILHSALSCCAAAGGHLASSPPLHRLWPPVPHRRPCTDSGHLFPVFPPALTPATSSPSSPLLRRRPPPPPRRSGTDSGHLFPVVAP